MNNTPNYLPYISLGVSLFTTAVSIGVLVGVFRSRILTVERDLNAMGKRFNDEVKAIKDEYIKEISERLKEAEANLKQLSESFARIDERIAGWYKHIDHKIDMLAEKMEKRS